MILLDLRTAIVAGIKAKLPDLKECGPHPGRFSLQELKALGARTPAVRVALLGVPSEIEAEGDGVRVSTLWAAFIITADRPRLPRDVGALGLVSALLPIIPYACWGLEDRVDSARQVKGENLFSREIDQQGVALWAITWRHGVTMGEIDPATLADFLLFESEAYNPGGIEAGETPLIEGRAELEGAGEPPA